MLLKENLAHPGPSSESTSERSGCALRLTTTMRGRSECSVQRTRFLSCFCSLTVTPVLLKSILFTADLQTLIYLTGALTADSMTQSYIQDNLFVSKISSISVHLQLINFPANPIQDDRHKPRQTQKWHFYRWNLVWQSLISLKIVFSIFTSKRFRI